MRSLSLLGLALIAPFVAAIDFSYPTGGELLKKGSTYNITWDSVNTDPGDFSIYLWNFVYYPPFYTQLATVNTADGAKSITIPCDLPAEDGYQFNAIAGSNVYVIYAQSNKFSLDDTSCSSPTVGSNPEGCAASTTTVTSTVSKPRATTTVTTTSVSTSTERASGTAKATTTVTITETAKPSHKHGHRHSPPKHRN